MLTVIDLYKRHFPANEIVKRSNGQYDAPCPSCSDSTTSTRFFIDTKRDGWKGGRYFCRSCHLGGDAIQFLREFVGMSYPDACREVGVDPSQKSFRSTEPHFCKSLPADETKQPWTPKPADIPSDAWRAAAAKFVSECEQRLSTSTEGQGYLKERGITIETAARVHLGWNPSDMYVSRESWGLATILKDNGQPKKLKLARGLVLPIRRKGGLSGVLIRCVDWTDGAKFPKFWQVPTVDNATQDSVYFAGRAGTPVFVVESLIDAVLIEQEGRGYVSAIALNGAGKRPDRAATEFLRAAPLVLWSLDNDAAGENQLAWWREHFPSIQLCPFFSGCKDAGDVLHLTEYGGRAIDHPLFLWIIGALKTFNAGPFAVPPSDDSNETAIPPEPETGTPSTPEIETALPAAASPLAALAGRISIQPLRAGASGELEVCAYCVHWQKRSPDAMWCFGRCGLDGVEVFNNERCHRGIRAVW